MARYDGSPDAFPGVRDALPDLNVDRWPDAPAATDEEHDEWAEDDTAERVVDLRPPSDPADWATSYDTGSYTSSFTLETAPPPPPADPPPYGVTDAVVADEPVAVAPVAAFEPAEVYEPAEAYEPTAPVETYPTTDTYESYASYASYEPHEDAQPAYEGRRRHAAAEVPEIVRSTPEPGRADWGIPPVPTGPSLTGADSLTADSVLRYQRLRPQTGWRKGIYSMSRGKINFGPSPADRHQADLLAAARTPITGCHRLAVISLKGGVGKTTTTAALGTMFATLRGDRVIAVDANPDRGTLAERTPRESGATVRHLLDARDRLFRYADVRHFTSQAPTRLEVLASDADPSASLAYSEQDYRDTVSTLERFYNLILTDCGTGLLHSAMHGILGLANSLVVVSSASLDGARSASATLDWLEAHGLGDLAKEAVVVISSVRQAGGIVDVMQLEDHFAARCRAVVTIPYDPHLEAGGVLDIDELAPDTLDAYRELAAAVAEGFPAAR
jgi:MinD-like ATPase involved in chromosome partitioning or flagellar assembly